MVYICAGPLIIGYLIFKPQESPPPSNWEVIQNEFNQTTNADFIQAYSGQLNQIKSFYYSKEKSADVYVTQTLEVMTKLNDALEIRQQKIIKTIGLLEYFLENSDLPPDQVQVIVAESELLSTLSEYNLKVIDLIHNKKTMAQFALTAGGENYATKKFNKMQIQERGQLLIEGAFTMTEITPLSEKLIQANASLVKVMPSQKPIEPINFNFLE